jgi:hypothetical protein
VASDNEAVVRRYIDEVWNGGRLEVVDEIVADQHPARFCTSTTRGWSARAQGAGQALPRRLPGSQSRD